MLQPFHNAYRVKYVGMISYQLKKIGIDIGPWCQYFVLVPSYLPQDFSKNDISMQYFSSLYTWTDKKMIEVEMNYT